MVLKHKNILSLLTVVVVIVLGTVFFSRSVSAAPHEAPVGGCDLAAGETEYSDVNTKKKMCLPKGETQPGLNGTTVGAAPTTTATTAPGAGITCAVEKIGWIVCPLIEWAGKASDGAFKVLADNFLRTDPELLQDTPGSGTKIGWEVMRNIANIMFIIAFLIIIIAQVTGQGLNNYAIKKMLPRLVIAAIAVNVSYYICQLVVDLTNILGYEIQNSLAQIADSVGPSVFGNSANITDFQQTPNGITDLANHGQMIGTVVAGILAAGALIYLLAGPMLAIIPVVLITVLTIIVILLLRKALIVLLVIISPIAFVMYLLPNTEKYFDKWRSMFFQLLMVFPVVGLLFGAGQLASTLILVAGSNGTTAQAAAECDPNDKTQKETYDKIQVSGFKPQCGEKAVQVVGPKDANSECTGTCNTGVAAPWSLGLVATGIAVAPLLAVFGVLQGALSAAGAIGKAATSAVSKGMNTAGKPLTGAAGGLGKRIDENRTAAWQRMQARGLDGSNNPFDRASGRLAKGRALRGARQNLSKQALDRASNHEVEGNIGNLLGGLTKGERERALRSAQAQKDHHAAEETKNALTAIEYSPEGKLKGAGTAFDNALSSGGDMTQAKAAIMALTSTGEKGIDALADKLKNAQLEANRTGNHEFVNSLKEYMLQAHGNVKEKNAAIGAWSSSGSVQSGQGATGQTVNDFAAQADTYSKLSDKQFASQTENSLKSTGALAALSRMSTSADGGQESRGYRLLSNSDTTNDLNDIKRALLANRSQRIDPPPRNP